MFNLYFTDWDEDGLPIPNGQVVFQSLQKQNIITTEQNPKNCFFIRADFEQMCRIANQEYTYTNQFVDNFIFLISYNLNPPIWDLVVPLKFILTEELVKAINNNGYLVFMDNEGWLHMPDILRTQATSLGIDIDRIFYITSDPTTNTSRNIFYNYPEEQSFFRVVNNIAAKDIVNITKTNPTKLYTSLVGVANPSKIDFLNKIVKNNLFDLGNISLLKLKNRYIELLCKELYSKYPIILDSTHDWPNKFTNTLSICSTSYIHIVHSSDAQYEPFAPTIFMTNFDLFTAVASKRPFIVVSYHKNKLFYVRDLGYKTFDNYFPEYYDSIDNNNDRLDAIINLLKELKSKNLDKLLLEMSDILDYNFNHFFRKTNRSAHAAVKKLKELIYVN
jgi:hypothetical protein